MIVGEQDLELLKYLTYKGGQMYKPELKDQIFKLISEFLTEERGNRVTTNNMMGFTAKVGNLFEVNKVEEKPAETKKG